MSSRNGTPRAGVREARARESNPSRSPWYRRWMLGLVEAEFVPTLQSDPGYPSPAAVGDGPGHSDPPCLQRFGSRDDVVAHQVQLMAALIGGMHGQFRRRESEDQPAIARIHGRKFKNLLEK